MVLLVGGEDDVVAHLATGNSGVVAHDGVVEADAELEVDVLAEEEAHGDVAVLAAAAVAHHAVGQHHAVLDARGGLFVGEDGHVVERAGVLDDTVAAHLSVAAFGGGEVVKGHLLETVDHLAVVAVFGPEVGVADGHAREGQDAAAATFVHGFNPFVLGILGGVGGGHLVDVEEQAMVAHAVATEHADVVHGAVVAHRGVGKAGVIETFRQAQVAVVHIALVDGPEPYASHKDVVADEGGIEGLGYLHIVPVLGAVAEGL